MLVLDTNVISEIMKASPSPGVMEWRSQQQSAELFPTTVTVAEILYGIEILPRGKRRDSLRDEGEWTFTQAFAGRTFPFPQTAARECPAIAASPPSARPPNAALY